MIPNQLGVGLLEGLSETNGNESNDMDWNVAKQRKAMQMQRNESKGMQWNAHVVEIPVLGKACAAATPQHGGSSTAKRKELRRTVPTKEGHRMFFI